MITINLPFPNMDLSANKIKGRPWYVNRRYSIPARKEGAFEAMNQVVTPLKYRSIKATITFHQPDARNRNKDNIITAFKSYQDGVADAIKIPDEKWDVVHVMGGIIKGGKTVLTIEGIE